MHIGLSYRYGVAEGPNAEGFSKPLGDFRSFSNPLKRGNFAKHLGT